MDADRIAVIYTGLTQLLGQKPLGFLKGNHLGVKNDEKSNGELAVALSRTVQAGDPKV